MSATGGYETGCTVIARARTNGRMEHLAGDLPIDGRRGWWRLLTTRDFSLVRGVPIDANGSGGVMRACFMLGMVVPSVSVRAAVAHSPQGSAVVETAVDAVWGRGTGAGGHEGDLGGGRADGEGVGGT